LLNEPNKTLVIAFLTLLFAASPGCGPGKDQADMNTKDAAQTRAGKLYFVAGTFSGAGAVKVIDADGSNETTLAEGKDVIEPDGIEVDHEGGKLYWTDMGLGGAADKSVSVDDGRIMRSDLDGKNIETLVPLGITTTPKQLALDVAGGKVYWSDRGDVGDESVNPKIMRSNLDGSSVETIVSSDLMSPVGIALDTANGKLYFTDRYANDIKRANLDGSDVEVVVRDTEYPVDLALDFDSRTVYWTAREAGGLYRADMDKTDIDGASLSPIITGLSAPIGVTLDRENGRLFYTDVIVASQSGAIWEAGLDGRNPKKLATTSLPLGLYFVP
jgi:sugar lactone lactonase YvrE